MCLSILSLAIQGQGALGGDSSEMISILCSFSECFGGNGASPKNNPKLPVLVQQDAIESHKASLPQKQGEEEQGD